MIGYQYLLDQLRAEIATIPMVNTITQGALDDIDNYKQSIFPVVHLIVNSVSPSSNTLEFNISIVAMDVVDISKDETTDKFYGNDNEIYVLNTTLAILVRIIDVLRRGSLSDKNIELTGTAALEPFTERFENYLAGWTATVSILVPNEMSVC